MGRLVKAAKWFARAIGFFVLLILVTYVFALVVAPKPGAVWAQPRKRWQVGVEDERFRQWEAEREPKPWEAKAAWRQWWHEHQAVEDAGKQLSNKGTWQEPAPGWEDGFEKGHQIGVLRKLWAAPDAIARDVTARSPATIDNVPEGEREAWEAGYLAGFALGFSKGHSSLPGD